MAKGKRRKSRRKKKQTNLYMICGVTAALIIIVLIAAIQNRNTTTEEVETLAYETGSEKGEEVVNTLIDENSDEAGKTETDEVKKDESKEDESEADTAKKDEAEKKQDDEASSKENVKEDENNKEEVDVSNKEGQTSDSTDTASENSKAALSKEQILALDTTKQGYGQGVNVDDKNRPTGATMLQDKYGKYDAYFIAEESQNIYLTFDEGYENGYTSNILDTLKNKNCPAVFFVTMDYVKKNPDLVQRMIDEGHVVGNHSVNHKSMPTLSYDDAYNEIAELHNYVKENFGYEMYLFRPPMGEFSEQTLALTQSLGYKTALWSYAYRDYDTENQPAVSEAYDKITKAKHPGAIYLLHAVSETNAAVLGDVIDDFRNSGYTVLAFPN